jgi:hypothetical protein
MITVELSDEHAETLLGFLGELLENPDDSNLPALLSAYTQIENQLHEDNPPCDDCGYEPRMDEGRLCQGCFDQWLNQASRGGR